MLIETMVLAVLIGYLKGGKLTNLTELSLKGIWLVLAAFAMQVLIYWAGVKEFGLGPSWFAPSLHIVSYCLLLIFILINRTFPGIKILALGIFLNLLVISFNGGLMPVDPAYLTEEARRALITGRGTHGLLSETTRLMMLADRFFIAIPWLGKQLFSLGDVLIDIGAFILIFKTMNSPRSYRIRTVSLR